MTSMCITEIRNNHKIVLMEGWSSYFTFICCHHIWGCIITFAIYFCSTHYCVQKPYLMKIITLLANNGIHGSPCMLSWASCLIRKIVGCACTGNAGKVFPRRRLQRKPLVSDPCVHHGTCVTHVPWCMSGSLARRTGVNVPSIPGACAPASLRIWQEDFGDV